MKNLNRFPTLTSPSNPGSRSNLLDDIAYTISDNEAAKRLQEARHKLFESIYERLLAG
jgi:hypothetical protein